MVVRELAAAEVGRVREIDRSEHAAGVYVAEDAVLRFVPRELEIPTWDATELADTVARLTEALENGGVLLGALDDGELVGAAVLGGERLASATHRLELVFLHVSRPHRRRGVARLLLDEVCRRARALGAEHLSISSSDVEPAVRFYLGYGCVAALNPDPRLVARWPGDVQLELSL